MTKSQTTNYSSISSPGDTFNSRISADTDPTDRNDIDALGKALEDHDHSSGKGLSVPYVVHLPAARWAVDAGAHDGNNPAARGTTWGTYALEDGWNFDDTTDEAIWSEGFLVPENWQHNTIRATVAWKAASATSGVVTWRINYSGSLADGEVYDVSGTTLATFTDTAADATTKLSLVSTNVAAPAGVQAGDWIRIMFKRVAGGMTGDAKFLGLTLRFS